MWVGFSFRAGSEWRPFHSQDFFFFSQPNMIPQLQLQEGKELNELPTNYLLPFVLQRGPCVQSGQEVKLSRDVLISDLFQRHFTLFVHGRMNNE